MPQSFWKVVVRQDPVEGIQSESFLMSQAKDVSGESPDIKYEGEQDMSPYRVPLSRIEELTKLKFEDLQGTDTFG